MNARHARVIRECELPGCGERFDVAVSDAQRFHSLSCSAKRPDRYATSTLEERRARTEKARAAHLAKHPRRHVMLECGGCGVFEGFAGAVSATTEKLMRRRFNHLHRGCINQPAMPAKEA